MRNDKQVREFVAPFKCTRADDESKTIEGYFSVYEQETKLFDNCFEIITTGALDESVRKNDIRALWNHNTQYVLGRKDAGTAEFKCDEKGLFAKIVLPNTSYANDLYELVKRGDVTQCSFGFYIDDETIEDLADGSIRFRINKADVFEVSVVTFPAYENTSVSAREKDIADYKQRKIDLSKAELRKRLEVLK